MDSTTVLTELADAARAAAERLGPSVVRIGRGGGRGCGVVFAGGLVVTNAHNLRDRTTTLTFGDGRQLQGEVLGADVDGDLAVLGVDTGEAPPAALGAAEARLGDVVFAVARGASTAVRVSFGIVSGAERAFRGPRGRRIRGSIEHTAPLPRGSSGSPVVDVDGAVVGLSTHRIDEGFYLALPADEELGRRLDALAAGRQRRRPTLGVGLAPAGVARKLRRSVGLPERDGLLVRGVEPASPADRASLVEGDLLVAADDRPLLAVDDLYDALEAAAEAGGSLRLGVVRGTDERTVTVRLEESSPEA